jgi:hypothetical protein
LSSVLLLPLASADVDADADDPGAAMGRW